MSASMQPDDGSKSISTTKPNMQQSVSFITVFPLSSHRRQAGLYYHYGIKKELLPKKLSGVYKHRVMNRKEPLVRGFDDVFMAPHSRYTQASRQQILDNPRLKVLADSDEAGIYIVLGDGGKEIFVMGHPEYDRLTLDQEYKRDIDKGIEPDLPVNYYPDDDCNRKPLLSWRSHANNLYTNWLNYYVYQITPYDLNESYDNYCI